MKKEDFPLICLADSGLLSYFLHCQLFLFLRVGGGQLLRSPIKKLHF